MYFILSFTCSHFHRRCMLRFGYGRQGDLRSRHQWQGNDHGFPCVQSDCNEHHLHCIPSCSWGQPKI